MLSASRIIFRLAHQDLAPRSRTMTRDADSTRLSFIYVMKPTSNITLVCKVTFLLSSGWLKPELPSRGKMPVVNLNCFRHRSTPQYYCYLVTRYHKWSLKENLHTTNGHVYASIYTSLLTGNTKVIYWDPFGVEYFEAVRIT